MGALNGPSATIAPYKDLFALQDEITRAVTGALRTKLLPGEHAAAQSERPPSGSLDAYNAFLQGQFFWSRNTEADTRKAIESFTHAIELDPRYALAWSGLSRAWASLGIQFLEGAPVQEAFAKARAAADRALSLSPELAAAHVARGYVHSVADFDWGGAEAEYRRAVDLAPNDGEAKFYFGRQLAVFGELERAIELTREALATEPLRANWHSWLATYLSGLNRLDEAERAIRRTMSCSLVERAITSCSRSSRFSGAIRKRRSPPRSRKPMECGRTPRSPSHDRSAVTALWRMLRSRR